jgi:hypothetical protein
MPLTRPVAFKAVLQKGNRVQIPRLIRWQFKLEPEQILKATVSPRGTFGIHETFYTHMNKDGRITIPKIALKIVQGKLTSLKDCILEIYLEPAEKS